jgi:hypothetical protein
MCRLCQLELAIRRTRKKWRIPEGRKPLVTAAGLAVPAVEGWYLCGKDPIVGEEDWRESQRHGRPLYTRRDLKSLVYRTTRPSLPLETRCAAQEARRLAKDLRLLENEFPIGFGHLAHGVRRWGKG